MSDVINKNKNDYSCKILIFNKRLCKTNKKKIFMYLLCLNYGSICITHVVQ